MRGITKEKDMDKQLMQQFREKFDKNPQRFKSLPGVSSRWPADRLVLMRAFSQAGKPQAEIARTLSLDRTTICKKLNSVNWTEFEACLKETLSEADSDFAKREVALFNENLHRRTENKLQDMDLKLESFRHVTEEMVLKHLAPLPVFPKYSARKTSKRFSVPEHVVLLLSDLHVGYKFDKEEVGGTNEYSLAIFKDRYMRLKKSLVDIFLLHSKMYDLPELHVLALGDMVHGTMLGGKWSPAYFETDVFSQAALATEAICDMILEWSQYFKKISFNGVIGNHGRGGVSRTSDKTKVNWDNVMYANVKARFAGRDNISVKTSDCWWQTVDVNGTKVLLLHGEHLSGKLAKLVAEEQSLQSILPQDSSKYNVLCMGHVHHSAECETSRGRVFVNGSFVGADPHGLGDLKVYSRPTQTIFGVHPTNKVTWKYNLDLAR